MKKLSICLSLCAIIALCGACKSKSSEKEVQITPTVAFTAKVSDKTVSFTNQSKDAIKYEWDFGDKSAIVTTTSPTHTYANYGSYNVTLKGYSKSNDTGMKKQTVTVLAPVCVADFSYKLGDDGVTVTFTNKSENAVRYSWDFGDKTTSTEKNPVHKYDVARGEAKIFTITLTAYPQSGKESAAALPITVVGKGSSTDPSIAEIYWTPTTPNVNDVVIFGVRNAQNVTSYKWEFGDGQTSTERNPTHKYTKAGNYTVKLTYGNSSTSKNMSSTITVNKETYKYATVVSYEITGLNWKDTDGNAWDVGNGPDIFIPYVYKGSSTTPVYGEDKSARTEDVTESMLPITHKVNWKLDATAKYTFELYDYDPIGSNELMTSFTFDIPLETTTNYPAMVYLLSDNILWDGFLVLDLEWSN